MFGRNYSRSLSDRLEPVAGDCLTMSATVTDAGSSLEEYSTELKSGRLEWSLVHKSDKFWRENASRLNDNNYQLLKILVSLTVITRD